MKTELTRLADLNRAYFTARGPAAAEPGKQLEAALDAFQRDRIPLLDDLRAQVEDAAIVRARSRMVGAAQAARGGPAHQGFQRDANWRICWNNTNWRWCHEDGCCIPVPARRRRPWAQVPTPESVLGHKPGDDFYLATYEDCAGLFPQAGGGVEPHQAGERGQDHARPRLVHRLHFRPREPGAARSL